MQDRWPWRGVSWLKNSGGVSSICHLMCKPSATSSCNFGRKLSEVITSHVIPKVLVLKAPRTETSCDVILSGVETLSAPETPQALRRVQKCPKSIPKCPGTLSDAFPGDVPKGPRDSCKGWRCLNSGVFVTLFGRERSHHVMDASCWFGNLPKQSCPAIVAEIRFSKKRIPPKHFHVVLWITKRIRVMLFLGN